MKTIKKLGIYIDETNAFLMELINKMIVSRNIEFETNEKIEDSIKFNQEVPAQPVGIHHLQSAYFIELCDIIKNYNQVVLFGPNEAKNELYKLLEFDHSFDNIKIKNADNNKMSENKMHDFVKEYYK